MKLYLRSQKIVVLTHMKDGLKSAVLRYCIHYDSYREKLKGAVLWCGCGVRCAGAGAGAVYRAVILFSALRGL